MSTMGTIQQLGFSIYESKILSALLEADKPSAKMIAQLSGVPKNKVYELLEELRKEGVIEVLATKPKRFRLLDLEGVAKTREAKRREVHNDALSALAPKIKKKKQKTDTEREIWTTQGTQSMLSKIYEILASTEKESIAFVDIWAGNKANYEQIKEAVDRGVKFYFLGPITDEDLPIIQKYASIGVQIREYPVDSSGYSIFDTEQVQLRVTDRNLISLWITNKYLAQTLREDFFKRWKKAKKYTAK